jgi:hypothetical protein
MRPIAILVVATLTSSTVAQVAINPASLNLGEVRAGPAVECSFELKNLGKQTVEIIDLERGCGCIEPRFSTRSLKPGEHATLAVKLRTLGQLEGPRSWPLTLVTRDAGAAKKQGLEIKGIMRNDIVIEPPQVALHVAKSLEQEITLIDRRDRPLTVTSWDAKMPGVRVEKIGSQPGITRLKLTVEGQQLPAGRHDHVLHLYTNDIRYDHLEVPITLVRIEPARVTWSPTTPEVILAPGQEKGSALVRMQRGDGAPLAVERAEAIDAGVSCVTSSRDDGSAFLKIVVDRSRFATRGLESSVRVTGAGETFSIPLIIRLE